MDKTKDNHNIRKLYEILKIPQRKVILNLWGCLETKMGIFWILEIKKNNASFTQFRSNQSHIPIIGFETSEIMSDIFINLKERYPLDSFWFSSLSILPFVLPFFFYYGLQSTKEVTSNSTFSKNFFHFSIVTISGMV